MPRSDWNSLDLCVQAILCLRPMLTNPSALGAFMATSDAEVAEVECYATENDTEPVALPGCECGVTLAADTPFLTQHRIFAVTTETFQAQYHVLEVFAIFAAVTSQSSVYFHSVQPSNVSLQFGLSSSSLSSLPYVIIAAATATSGCLP
jgi:hypothetical protein